jgi:segregation and condensation protein A
VTATPGFVVELPVFQGPFRLLADLILDRTVDVCDIPVATVTDRFVREGREAAGAWSLEEATWFLAICAVLLELKVGRLLPRHVAESEEDLLGGASPDLVYARSLELAAFRRMSERLGALISEASMLVARAAGPPEEFAHLYPDVMEKVTAEGLRAVAAELFRPEPVLDLSHVTPIRASLADALDVVRAHLAVSPEARFRDLVEGCEERIEVVVRFLALLELYRRGHVELSQAERFGEIQVRWQGGGEAPSESDEIEEYG